MDAVLCGGCCVWNVCGCCACSTLKCSYRSEEESYKVNYPKQYLHLYSICISRGIYKHIETENAVELVIMCPQYGIRLSACPVVVFVIYILSE